MNTISYWIIFIIVNCFAVVLGQAQAFGDKKKMKTVFWLAFIFVIGILVGITYML